MRDLHTALIPALLTTVVAAGCFKPIEGPDGEQDLDFSAIPFENEFVQSSSVVVSAFDAPLSCPDGQTARFFAVYDQNITGQAPLAVVLHSGAFDFVLEPDPADPLVGEHYQGDGRLNRGWSTAKVWETLGMHPSEVDKSEDNAGALTAALSDAGFVQLYPANCWGDLWHNEEGSQDNDADSDGFFRNGRTMAWWMIRLIVDGSFATNVGFSLPVGVDTADIHLIGLGEGGRGVAELVLKPEMIPVASITADGSPDLLSAFLDDEENFGLEADGIERIYRTENLDTVDDGGFAGLYDVGALPDNVAYIWSDGDPRLPQDATRPTAELLEANGVGWVHNSTKLQHVSVTNDYELANDLISYITTGVAP